MPEPEPEIRNRYAALWVSLAYAVAGALWLLFSDRLLAFLVSDSAQLTEYQTYKGWLFVAVTAVLLYVVARYFGRYAPDISAGSTRFAGQSSIRTQLMILVVVVIAPMLAADVAGFYRQAEFYRRNALEQTLSLARIVSARVDEHFREMDTLLLAVSAAVSPELGSVEANDAKLRQIQHGLPGYFNSISVLATDGSMFIELSAVLRSGAAARTWIGVAAHWQHCRTDPADRVYGQADRRRKSRSSRNNRRSA